MWGRAGGPVGGGWEEPSPQVNRCCWHSFTRHVFEFTIKHNSWLNVSPHWWPRITHLCAVSEDASYLISPLSLAGQRVCRLICSSCDEACCLYVNVQACVSASTVAPSKILAFGVCPSCCLLDVDLLLACVPISTFRHVTCALLSRDGAESPSLMLCLSFWMIPCIKPHWKRTTVFTPVSSLYAFPPNISIYHGSS